MEPGGTLVIACLGALPYAGGRRRRVGGPVPFGTKPGPLPRAKTVPGTPGLGSGLDLAHHEIVPMHHLGAAAEA